ncbi:MAG TPA: HI0074 family nucleotidyltransferase substrate-binding subunit [Acetobacteraceae bacterium]|jgi:nucleotidyltransferase substrate binding protein (TIGR01987 family)
MSDSASTLDISPLASAVGRLREGLERHRREPHDEQLRDGLIQRFEFTYELSHRMLRRYLRMVAASTDLFDRMPFQDLIRTGDEQGLLHGDWPLWRRFRDTRARTSHTNSAPVAQQVVAGIPDFLAEATYLLDQLRQRLR